MPPAPEVPALVLLEGPSDVAALEAVLAARGPEVTGTAYRLVDLGGVTNTGRQLRAAARRDPPPRVVGLCDEGEAWVVVRALREVGRDVPDVRDLPRHGFFVCRRDLEEELIRALGVEACLALLDGMALGHRFRAFSRQRAWAGRPVEDRLHRFAGIASGRKIRLAGAMAAALGPDQVPPPIADLVTLIVSGRPAARTGGGASLAGPDDA